MNTIEVLNKMKDVLIERGWTQAVLENNKGQVCLIGARNKVLGITTTEEGGYQADYTSDLIESVLPEYTHRKSHEEDTRLWKFNDSTSSLNEVLDAIDLAIYTEKERS